MRFANSNLTSVLLPESSGDDGVAIQEQLLDKLIKKTLTNFDYSRDYHRMIFLNVEALERLCTSSHPVGQKNRAPILKG